MIKVRYTLKGTYLIVLTINRLSNSYISFSYSKKLELRHEDNCAEVGQISDDENEGLVEGFFSPIKMSPCDENEPEQKWKLSKKGRMMHLGTKKCLDVVATGSEESGTELNLVAVDCKRAASQLWSFDQNFQ